MTTPDTSDIHRHLDAAFAGIEMTPDAQDLKEEIRGNLAARSAELQSGGVDPATAAETAVRELGDIRSLVDSVKDDDKRADSMADLMERNRVRPNPGFVVRAVLLSLVFAGAALLVALAELSLLAWPVAVVAVLSGVTALALGALVADSLRQETSQEYPMPTRRALGFGIGTALLIGGLLFGTSVVGSFGVAPLVAAIVLGVAAIVLFSWLGVTQTNRRKPWALALARSAEFEDRFSRDPVAAARFGMYTVIIWVLGLAIFVVLSITVGFAWSWLALVATLVVFFLVLSRMLFAPEKA